LIDTAIDTVNNARSAMGATMNQLSYSADNMTNISTNIAASRSTIQDTDYASASAQLAKNQIISQAATAMLAQANQQPQSVLSLLKG
jgi:flagellin